MTAYRRKKICASSLKTAPITRSKKVYSLRPRESHGSLRNSHSFVKHKPKPTCRKMTTQEQVEDTIKWPPHLEKMLIDVLVEEVNKGTSDSVGFSKIQWRNITDEFNKRAKVNPRKTYKQIKGKFNRLRMKHRSFSTLLNEPTGFGWDPEKGTVTADEDAWARHLLVYPTATQFKTKGCANYNLLGIIFNKTTATGVLQHASTQDPPNSDEERHLDEALLNGGVHVDLDADEEIVDVDTPPPANGNGRSHSGKRSGSTAPPRSTRKKRQNVSEQLSATLVAMEESCQSRSYLNNKKQERLKDIEQQQMESSNVAPDPCSIKGCMAIMSELDPPVSSTTYLKAVLTFKEDWWRTVFATMPPEHRIEWLASL